MPRSVTPEDLQRSRDSNCEQTDPRKEHSSISQNVGSTKGGNKCNPLTYLLIYIDQFLDSASLYEHIASDKYFQIDEKLT